MFIRKAELNRIREALHRLDEFQYITNGEIDEITNNVSDLENNIFPKHVGSRPTIRNEVDAIIKHLGLAITVKQASLVKKPSELVVSKIKKGKK